MLAPGVQILYEDERVLAIDKPAGVVSVPTTAGARKTCALRGRYDAGLRTFRYQGGVLWLVHRLDLDTSGVLLTAKDEATHLRLLEAFEQGRVVNKYLALLKRVPRKEEGLWEDHLVRAKVGGQVRSRVLPDREPNARARYRLLRAVGAERWALVELTLETGLTHQLRVQAASRGAPILGDRVYGDFEVNKRVRRELGLGRLFLHHAALELPGAGHGLHACYRAPLPPELARVVEPRKG